MTSVIFDKYIFMKYYKSKYFRLGVNYIANFKIYIFPEIIKIVSILLQADNVGEHTTYNWFHSSRAEYRALTTRFLVCSWTAYAFPHHCLFFNAMFNQFSLERGFIFHLVLTGDSPSKEHKLGILQIIQFQSFLFEKMNECLHLN